MTTAPKLIRDLVPLADALENSQQQCDADGTMIAVSRQAVDETISLIRSLAAEPVGGELHECMEILIDDYAKYEKGDPKMPFMTLRASILSTLNAYQAERYAGDKQPDSAEGEAQHPQRPDGGEWKWREMSSAPKTGLAILALLPDSNIPVSVRFHAGGWHVAWDGHQLGELDQPVKWMHIPDEDAAASAPPAVGEGDVRMAHAFLREICEEMNALDCGPCIGSMAPWEDLHGRIAGYLANTAPPIREVGEQPKAEGGDWVQSVMWEVYDYSNIMANMPHAGSERDAARERAVIQDEKIRAMLSAAPQPEQSRCGTCDDVIQSDPVTGTTCRCAQPEQPARDGVVVDKVELADKIADDLIKLAPRTYDNPAMLRRDLRMLISGYVQLYTQPPQQADGGAVAINWPPRAMKGDYGVTLRDGYEFLPLGEVKELVIDEAATWNRCLDECQLAYENSFLSDPSKYPYHPAGLARWLRVKYRRMWEHPSTRIPEIVWIYETLLRLPISLTPAEMNAPPPKSPGVGVDEIERLCAIGVSSVWELTGNEIKNWRNYCDRIEPEDLPAIIRAALLDALGGEK